jgi:catechol 2,3-dioxygenase-like lactoylglutathione lyase family enzyme
MSQEGGRAGGREHAVPAAGAARPELAYVALVVDDVEAVAAVLTRHLGLSRRDVAGARGGRPVPLLGIGRTALALLSPGDPVVEGPARPGVHHLALACDDPVGRAAAAGLAGATATLAPAPGGGGRLRLPREATAGVLTYLVEPLPLPGPGDGRIERLDHVGVACADNVAAVAVFTGALGGRLESSQTDLEVAIAVESFTSDRYGVVYHSRPPEPVGGLRVSFVTVGDCELEFLQDLDLGGRAQVDGGRAGTTRQDRGAIARFVASRGPGLHHLAFKVPDADAGLRALGEAGLRTIDRCGRPGSRRARIGFLHPSALGGVLAHLVERPAA